MITVVIDINYNLTYSDLLKNDTFFKLFDIILISASHPIDR